MENPRFMDEDGKGKKKEFGKKKDGKKDKKDKGYKMFEAENSEEESLVTSEEKDGRTPMKLKKHSKPSFKLVKKEKSYKPKEKEKEEKKKDDKKKDDKFKFKKKRHPPEAQPAAINEKPVFGVPLAVAVARNKSYDGVQLPAIFRECIDYVEEFGLSCEGIYRISGVKSKVQSLKDAYNKGIPVYLQEYEPNVVAGLLKQFLRDLPEPVLTEELLPKFEQASTVKNVKQRVGEFQRLIEQLPTPNRLLLSWVIIHMTHVIAKEKQNKMSMQNVSIVLSPTMQISHRVLNVLFSYWKILFKDTVIKKYVPPLKPVTSRWSLDLPESPTSLEEELRKQEILLEELHKEVMRVKDTAKEEQLWEVQRVVTGLKRKLKLIKKGQAYSPNTHRVINKEANTAVKSDRSKAEPPKQLNLKIREEEIDLRPAESASQLKSVTSQQKSLTSPTGAKPFKADSLQAPKVSKKLGGLRPVGTPTKDSAMDIGTIEMDSSAQSHSQRERADSSKHDVPIETRSKVESQTERSKTEVLPSTAEEVTKAETKKSEVKAGLQAQTIPKTAPEIDKKDKPTGEIKPVPSNSSQVNVNDSVEVEVKSECSVVKAENKPDKDENVPEDVSNIQITKTEEPSKKGKDVELKTESNEDIEAENDSSKTTESPTPDSTIIEEDEQNMQEVSDIASAIPKTLVVPPTKTPNSSPANFIDEGNDKSAETDASKQTSQTSQIVEKSKTQPIPQKVAVTLAPKSQDLPPNKDKLPVHPIEGGVAPEQLAAALSDLVDEVEETEEETNQQIMSRIMADFGIEKPEECDEEYEELLEEYTTLLLEEEELVIIGDELKKKIESEQYESDRLEEELTEIRAMREDLYSSDDNSDSSDSDDDEDDLQVVLDQLTRDNEELQAQNKDMTKNIHQEVQDCLKTKVQIRLLQHKQLESSKNNELDLLL